MPDEYQILTHGGGCFGILAFAENRGRWGMKCPKCKEGFLGMDSTGEAVDCHYCNCHGNITPEMYVEAFDKRDELIGDFMAMECRLKELIERWEEISEKQQTDWYNDCGSIDSITEELREIVGDGE